MAKARATPLALAEDFFRQRNLLFDGESYGLPGNGLVRGVVWDPNDRYSDHPRKFAEISVTVSPLKRRVLLMRFSGSEDPAQLDRLAGDFSNAIKRDVLIERASSDRVYLPMRPPSAADFEAKERKKENKAIVALFLLTILILLGLCLFGEWLVPILRQRGIYFSETVLIVRALIFLIFKT